MPVLEEPGLATRSAVPRSRFRRPKRIPPPGVHVPRRDDAGAGHRRQQRRLRAARRRPPAAAAVSRPVAPRVPLADASSRRTCSELEADGVRLSRRGTSSARCRNWRWSRTDTFTLTGDDNPERVRGSRVTASLMPLLGIAPRLGRNFTPAEDLDGTAPRRDPERRPLATPLSAPTNACSGARFRSTASRAPSSA